MHVFYFFYSIYIYQCRYYLFEYVAKKVEKIFFYLIISVEVWKIKTDETMSRHPVISLLNGN